MDKRIEKLIRLKIGKKELESLLQSLGFSLAGGKGSHRIWRNSQGLKVVIATHNKEVPSYIQRQVRALLLRENLI